MSAKEETWCAHTMIAAIGNELTCCDCGRSFRDKEHVARVQHYETETGFVMEEENSSPKQGVGAGV